METTPPVITVSEPQLAESIGAVARVMANFGLSELRLVRPRDGWPQDRAWASASGATWPLDGARVYERLEAAVADLRLVYATTARPRETQLPVITPRAAAETLHAAVARGQRVGMLFGGERAGLETGDIALCHAIVTIPVDERFRSLNLAQAVALNAYEWRLGVADAPRAAFAHNIDEPADMETLVGLYEQLEGQLEEAGFFHPPEKKPPMVRNLRVALGRARLTDQEVRTWRGMITALSKGRGRVLERLAREKSDKAAKGE